MYPVRDAVQNRCRVQYRLRLVPNLGTLPFMHSDTPIRSYLKRVGMTAEDFAAKHAFSPWSVRHWARGDKHPNQDAQVRMGEVTKGEAGPEAWLAYSLSRIPQDAAA